MNTNTQYPYLAYSELTQRVYIVLSKDEKLDVTSQYENIYRLKAMQARNNAINAWNGRTK